MAVEHVRNRVLLVWSLDMCVYFEASPVACVPMHAIRGEIPVPRVLLRLYVSVATIPMSVVSIPPRSSSRAACRRSVS